MANKNITPVITEGPDKAKEFAFTSLAASDKVIVPCNFKDEHTMLLFLGGEAKATVTIKAGNAYMGVNDEIFSLDAGKYAAITINSSRFKNITGEDKGNVIISVSAACSLAVVEARV